METDNPHRADLVVSLEPFPLPTTQLLNFNHSNLHLLASCLDFNVFLVSVSTEGWLLLIYIYIFNLAMQEFKWGGFCSTFLCCVVFVLFFLSVLSCYVFSPLSPLSLLALCLDSFVVTTHTIACSTVSALRLPDSPPESAPLSPAQK